MRYISNSARETNRIAKEFASRLCASFGEPRKITKGAIVIGLCGDLGAGKTTFTKSFAKALGVKEPVKSPTFNLMKVYPLKVPGCSSLIHIDTYRLKNAKDLDALEWKKLIKSNENIILVEWAERVEKAMPKSRFNVKFRHLGENTRGLDILALK